MWRKETFSYCWTRRRKTLSVDHDVGLYLKKKYFLFKALEQNSSLKRLIMNKNKVEYLLTTVGQDQAIYKIIGHKQFLIICFTCNSCSWR